MAALRARGLCNCCYSESPHDFSQLLGVQVPPGWAIEPLKIVYSLSYTLAVDSRITLSVFPALSKSDIPLKITVAGR